MPNRERKFVSAAQELIAVRALDRIGKVLRQQGLPLEEMIDAGRQERTTIIIATVVTAITPRGDHAKARRALRAP